jgi:hypothetical protein
MLEVEMKYGARPQALRLFLFSNMGKTKGSSIGRTTASGPNIARHHDKSTKRRGELSELAFVYKAASIGFAVAKPYGDSERYDFILDAASRLWRVQIKFTTQFLNGQYRLNAHRRIFGRAIAYLPSEIDFPVAHIIPEDTWYVIPLLCTEGCTSLFFPAKHSPRPSRFAPYHEAWHLFRSPP